MLKQKAKFSVLEFLKDPSSDHFAMVDKINLISNPFRIKNNAFRLGDDVSDLGFMENSTVVDVVRLVLLEMHKCE